MKFKMIKNNGSNAFAWGFKLGMELSKGKSMSRTEIVELLGCSVSTATRYMYNIETLTPIDRRLGSSSHDRGYIKLIQK